MAATLREYTQVLARYQPQAAFFYSQVAGVGTVGGAVSLTVSAFFGYDCLYPATITGFCFCAWAGAALSRTPQQEVWNQKFKGKFLSSLPRTVRQYLDSTSKWVEFRRWPPVSNDHIPPAGLFSAVKRIFSPSNEFVAVRAFTNGNSLKYVAINLQTQAKISGKIQIDVSIKKTMKLLKNCFVALEDDGSPVFSLSYHTLSSTDGSGAICADLLLRQKDSIWNIYDKKTQRVTFIKEGSLSYRCSPATIAFFKNKNIASVTDQILYARELILYKKPCSSAFYLEPIHQSSGFNTDILVSKFMWAVTLIRYLGPSGNHAELIIEGINDGFFPKEIVPIGKYFLYLADLLGAKKIMKEGLETEVRAIRTSLKSKFNLKYEARSSTWKCTSNSVKDMIHAIEEEKGDPPPGFAIYGRHSIFASKKVVEDSCITWALSRLKLINIVLDANTEWHPIFYTNTSRFTPLKPEQKDPQFDTLLLGLIVDESKLI